MWWIVSLVTLIVFIPLAIAEAFMALVAANGYMGNTDPLVYSYLACQGFGILALSLLSGLLARLLSKRLTLPLWLGGAISVMAFSILQLGVSLGAFIFAIAFFAP